MDEIVTEIDIDESPKVVWDVLTDFDAHLECNPVVEIDGDAAEGKRLEVMVAITSSSSPPWAPLTVRG